MRLFEEETGAVVQYLMTYGVFGLFALALLDAAFLPLPSLTDAMLFVLTASRPSWMLIYAGATTVATTIGCVILYKISQRAGMRALERFPESKRTRVKEWIDRYDLFAVLIANLMPPPFPFKLVVISAGVFEFNLFRFTLAIFIGRGFRSLIEAYIAAHYGAQAEEIFGHYYPYIALTIGTLVVTWLVVKFIRQRRNAQEEAMNAE